MVALAQSGRTRRALKAIRMRAPARWYGKRRIGSVSNFLRPTQDHPQLYTRRTVRNRQPRPERELAVCCAARCYRCARRSKTCRSESSFSIMDCARDSSIALSAPCGAFPMPPRRARRPSTLMYQGRDTRAYDVPDRDLDLYVERGVLARRKSGAIHERRSSPPVTASGIWGHRRKAGVR